MSWWRASTCARRSLSARCVSGEVLAVGALLLEQVGNGVEAEPVDAHVEPVVDGAVELLDDVGVLPVEIRLVRVEAMPVVRLRDRVPAPVGRLEVLEDDAGVLVLVDGVAPHVPVAVRMTGGGPARALEPGVLVGRVVEHELGDHAQAARLRLLHEQLEAAHVPVVGVDRAVVGRVVAVVAQGRGVEGQQPDRRDAEVLQVVEPGHQPAEVADPVPVGVAVHLHVQLVDDGVLVPPGCLRVLRHRMGIPVCALVPRAHTHLAGVRTRRASAGDRMFSERPAR